MTSARTGSLARGQSDKQARSPLAHRTYLDSPLVPCERPLSWTAHSPPAGQCRGGRMDDKKRSMLSSDRGASRRGEESEDGRWVGKVLRDSPGLIRLPAGRPCATPAQVMLFGIRSPSTDTVIPHAGHCGTDNPGVQMCHPTSRRHR